MRKFSLGLKLGSIEDVSLFSFRHILFARFLGMIIFSCFFGIADVTEGCRNFKIYVDSLDDWSLLDCNIVCCRGDRCNNQTISSKPTEATAPTATKAMSNTTDEPTTAGHPSHYSPTTAMLAFATIVAAFLF